MAVAALGYYHEIEKPDQIPGTYVILSGLLQQGGLATMEQILNDMGHETDQGLSMLAGRLERQIALGRTQGHV